MLSKSPTALLALLLLAAPVALAADHHDHGGPEPHTYVVAEFELDGATHYVVEDHGAIRLWKETNGLTTDGQHYRFEPSRQSGLQVQMVCVHDGEVEYPHHDATGCAEGEPVPADTRLTIGGLVAGLLP